MSQASASTTGMLRVTVASGTRRVDLVLPGAVPVAELVPELARSVGLLDPTIVHGGYRLVTADGRRLDPDPGLAVQGVEDGGVLVVAAGVDDPAPRVYDDVVEAMADVVEHELRPWEPASGRRTALGAAGVLMALGAVAVLLQRGSPPAGVGAAVVAAALVTGAVVLSRVQHEAEAAVAVAWTGAGYAAVAGLALVDRGALLGLPVAAAGGAAAAAGLVCLVGIGAGRSLVLPPVVVGAVLLAAGLVVQAAGLDPAVVLTTTLALVVLAGSVLPWLALGATGTAGDRLSTTADITAEPRPIDPARVSADARVAHEILVAVSATIGLLLVLVAPLAVSRGLAGVLLAATCCLVVVLRTRRHRTGTEVLVGLVSGLAGLASTAVSLLWLHPDWRPSAAVVLAAAGGVMLALTLVPSTPSVRRGLLGDVAESVALLALLPLLVVAVGLLPAIRG